MQYAVAEYLEREKAAHAGPGAVDLAKINREVAHKHGVMPGDLIRAVNDETIKGSC
jgi:hypothetical protein